MRLSCGLKRNHLWIKLRGCERDFEFVRAKALCGQPRSFGLQGEGPLWIEALIVHVLCEAARAIAALPGCCAIGVIDSIEEVCTGMGGCLDNQQLIEPTPVVRLANWLI